MKCFWSLLVCLLCLPALRAQEFETYYQSGALQSRTPINEQGKFEGLGVEYHPDGSVAAEVPYQAGQVHGDLKEYFPDGQLKLQQTYVRGSKQGKMLLYDADGRLRMYALMAADTVLLAQQFNGRGRLISETVGYFAQPIDTSNLAEPIVWMAEGRNLIAGQPNDLRIFIPRFPTAFIQYASGGGVIEASGRQDYPIRVIPAPDQDTFTLYLRLKTHSRAQPSVLRMLTLPVLQPQQE